MKTLLVSLALVAVGAWQLNEHPFVLTLTPIEDVALVPVEASDNPATTTTPHPATTTKPTPNPRPTGGTETPASTPHPTGGTTGGTTPGAAPAVEPVAEDYAEQVAELVLQKTNIERAKNDLAELSYNRTLASIAREHSADMQANNYFEHEDQAGCDSSCRADNAGYKWEMIGENIYMMSGFKISADAAAEKIVQGWMNSPGHRANILKAGYTETGVGVVAVGKDIYATTNYGTPR